MNRLFEVRISKKAQAEVKKILKSGQKKTGDRIMAGLAQLSSDPFTPRPGADILQLEAVDPTVYRLRIGKYRVMYTIDQKKKIVWVTMVLHRKKAYK